MPSIVYVLGYVVVFCIGLAAVVKVNNSGTPPLPTWSLRDFLYICGYFVLITIGILTFYFGAQQDIVDRISFAGTIASLLLSVVAIIYAVYQGSSAYIQTQALNDTSKSITATSNRLDETSSRFQLAVDNLRSAQTELATAIMTVSATAQELTAIRSDVANVNERLGDLFVQRVGAQQEGTISSQALDINNVISSVSDGGLIVLYLAVSHQLRKTSDRSLINVIDEINLRIKEAELPDIPFYYANGYYGGFSCTGLVEWSNSPFAFKLYDLSVGESMSMVVDQLEERIKEKVSSGQLKRYKAVIDSHPF